MCFKTRASFGAHHENLNEDRDPYTISDENVPNDSTFWQYKVSADARLRPSIQVWYAALVVKITLRLLMTADNRLSYRTDPSGHVK